MANDFRALGKALEPEHDAPEKTQEDVETGLDFLRFVAGITELFLIEMPKAAINLTLMALPDEKASQDSDDFSE